MSEINSFYPQFAKLIAFDKFNAWWSQATYAMKQEVLANATPEKKKSIMDLYRLKVTEYFASHTSLKAYQAKPWQPFIKYSNFRDDAPQSSKDLLNNTPQGCYLESGGMSADEKYKVNIYKNGQKIDQVEDVVEDLNSQLLCILSQDQKSVYYVARKNDSATTKEYVVKYHEIGTKSSQDQEIYCTKFPLNNKLPARLSNDSKGFSVDNKFFSNAGTVNDISGLFKFKYTSQVKLYTGEGNTVRNLDFTQFTSNSIWLKGKMKCEAEPLILLYEKDASGVLPPHDLHKTQLAHIVLNKAGSYDLKIGDKLFPLSCKYVNIEDANLHKSGQLILKCLLDAKPAIIICNPDTQELILKLTAQGPHYDFTYQSKFNDDNISIFYKNINGLKQKIEFDSSSLKPISKELEKEFISVDGREWIIDGDKAPVIDTSLVSEHLLVPTRDGKEVPVAIVYNKALVKLDGSNPLYLTSYSAFGKNCNIMDDPLMTALVKKGLIYVNVEARGSSALGKTWYLNGTGSTKHNTINDIKDALDYLIDNKYASKGNIAFSGTSAGGFNVSSLINKHPDYFKAAVLNVPVVKLRPESINYSRPEDCVQNSPIDNIKPAKYPTTYITGGMQDQRVSPYDALEYAIKLEANNLGDSPILLNVHENRGHDGGLNSLIEELSFIEAQFGLALEPNIEPHH